MKNHFLGFNGILSQIEYRDTADIQNVQEIDLVTMAHKALHYLKNNPLPDKNYQCRFSFSPMTCPPLNPLIPSTSDFVDPIMIGDTESRNDMAFNMMRMMTGELTYGLTEQEQVHNRLLSYIKEQGTYSHLCWNSAYSVCICDGSTWASLWSTGMLLQSECDRFRLNPEKGDLGIASKLFDGICQCAVRENGRAYFHAGGAFFNQNTVADPYRGHYPMIMGPLCEYYDVSKDIRCYELLTEIAEGFLYDLTPFHLHRDDGGIDGHNHVQLHAIRGMAQFAYLTKNARYLDWVKLIYDYYRKWALDTGWLPEIRDLSDHSTHSETCLNADMHEIEIWLALSGYSFLWDRIDRSTRNYFAPCQFKLTSETEAMYRQINSNKKASDIAASIELLKSLEGGFISALTPNDRIFTVPDGTSHFGQVAYQGKNIVYDMMGCCPPEGMRAIYYTWKYTVTKNLDGIHINLPYTISTSYADITSYLPKKGKLSVKAKQFGVYFIRSPQWTERSQVRAYQNGVEIAVHWGSTSNEYVKFDCVYPCDEISITYPLIDFWQEAEVTPHNLPVQKYSYHWIGNSVVDVSPKGAYLPLYDSQIF